MSNNKCWDGNKRLLVNRTQQGDIDKVAVTKQLRHFDLLSFHKTAVGLTFHTAAT